MDYIFVEMRKEYIKNLQLNLITENMTPEAEKQAQGEILAKDN